MMAASALARAFVRGPYTPNRRAFAETPALGFLIGQCIEPVHNTLSDHIRAFHNPKSPHLRRFGSNDRKGTRCFMPAD